MTLVIKIETHGVEGTPKLDKSEGIYFSDKVLRYRPRVIRSPHSLLNSISSNEEGPRIPRALTRHSHPNTHSLGIMICLADLPALYPCLRQSRKEPRTPRPSFTPELSPPDSSTKPTVLACLPLPQFPRLSGSHGPLYPLHPLLLSDALSMLLFQPEAGFPLRTQLPLYPSSGGCFLSSVSRAAGAGAGVVALSDPQCRLSITVPPSSIKRLL